MDKHEIVVNNIEGIVVAESGNIQIVVDTTGKILNDRDELTQHEYINDVETEIALDIIRSKKPLPVIPLKVYFQHVKASLYPIDEVRLRPYMARLTRVAKHMKSLGQIGGYEEACRRLLISARELDMKANHGIEFSISKGAVEEWMHFTQDTQSNWFNRSSAPVVLKKFKDFPRLVPTDVEKIILDFQKKDIFDDFQILYIDTSGQGDDVGDSSDTVRERDPILFGTIDVQPNKYYYITAWDDEHCDLTFDEMVETANFEEGDFSNIPEEDEIDEDYIAHLEEEVLASQKNSSRHSSFGISTGSLPGKDPKTGRRPSRVWERIKAKMGFSKD